MISNTHRKSGSCQDFNYKDGKEGVASLNINGQLVKDNHIIDEDAYGQEERAAENMGNAYSTLDNFKRVNKQNEDNMNEFINELEREEDLEVKSNVLYSASNSKIIQYFDYTSKFGYVYLISSDFNFLGICFNDFSNLIQNISLSMIDNKHKLCYNYFDKEHKNLFNFDEAGLESYIKQKTTNKELGKKCEIFKQISQKYTNEINNMKPLFGNIDSMGYSIQKVIFLKDFMKVQQAVMFRLSNKLVQICFVDSTEIVMSTESADFIFKNKNGEEIFDSIMNGLSSENNDIIKRIKFAKSLMIYFVKTYKGAKKK